MGEWPIFIASRAHVSSLPLPQYVVFGEALTDMIQQQPGIWKAVPGGSCWNVARVAARLGVAAGYAGAVSRDTFGQELARETKAAGLDMRFLQQVDRAPLLAMVASSHPPSYFFVGDNSADLAFDASALPNGWRQAARVVHFGGISLARPPLAEVLVREAKAASDAGLQIALDPNFREPMRSPGYGAVFAAMLAVADLIKVSEEDLQGLYPGEDVKQALVSMRASAPSALVLLTKGSTGMTLFDGDQIVSQHAVKVEVVDTVGCGDAVMGAWIAARLTGAPNHHASHLALASQVAALVARRAGAYAPSLAELEAFRKDL
jgi:fructokinase